MSGVQEARCCTRQVGTSNLPAILLILSLPIEGRLEVGMYSRLWIGYILHANVKSGEVAGPPMPWLAPPCPFPWQTLGNPTYPAHGP